MSAVGNAEGGDVLPSCAELRRHEREATLACLATTVTHQLGSPLNVLSGRAALALRECEQPAVSRHLASMVEQVQRMTSMLSELSRYAERPRGVARGCRLAPLLDAAVEAVLGLARARGVSVATEVGREFIVTVDAAKFFHLLTLALEVAIAGAAAGDRVFAYATPYTRAPDDPLPPGNGEYVAVSVRRTGNQADMPLWPRGGRAPWREPSGERLAAALERQIAEGVAAELGAWLEGGEGEGVNSFAWVVSGRVGGDEA